MFTELIPITLNPPTSPTVRSAGIHVSSVIREIALETHILDPKYATDLGLVELPGQAALWWGQLTPTDQLRISIGLAWEDWYLRNQEEINPHPGELELDGIFLTPDGESLSLVYHNRLTLCAHEVKATYKSPRTVGDLSSQWMWVTQIKSYLKAMGERHGLTLVDAYLHVLFLCGDYKYPLVPMLGPVRDEHHCWHLRFTPQEIDDSWGMITDYVRERTAEGRDDAGLESGV